MQVPGSTAHARLPCSIHTGPPGFSRTGAFGCRGGAPAFSNAQGRTRRDSKHSSASCLLPRSHHQEIPPAFVILKLLGKPLLSRELTAASVLLPPSLPRGLQMGRVGLLPSRSSYLAGIPPAVRKSCAQHGALHGWQVHGPQQGAAGQAFDEGQLHLLQDRSQRPSPCGSNQAMSSTHRTARPSGQHPHPLGAVPTPSQHPAQAARGPALVTCLGQ